MRTAKIRGIKYDGTEVIIDAGENVTVEWNSDTQTLLLDGNAIRWRERGVYLFTVQIAEHGGVA